ncbi:MAG: lipoate--protein ligase family protein [Elusimicrobia bacterium]|nr:lipoate--protein ligase family protein [Elusimicrobiota bacterium]MBU2615217.1 lipoate--protein ligase family protein [Elusimicrobiota bacterium]
MDLAFDEALLLLAEKSVLGETIRFWESKEHFVVLGTSNKIEQEVNIEACKLHKIPVFRRSSAGGTVLQGPGCLNFSFILPYKRNKALSDVNKSYTYILEKVIESAKKITGIQEISFKPISDIVLGEKKVSGNAQQRKKNFMLHHGTWLYNFDLGLISKYLKEPSKQPEYRLNRKHSEFVTNVPINVEEFKSEITKSFNISQQADVFDKAKPLMEELLKTKYQIS